MFLGPHHLRGQVLGCLPALLDQGSLSACSFSPPLTSLSLPLTPLTPNGQCRVLVCYTIFWGPTTSVGARGEREREGARGARGSKRGEREQGESEGVRGARGEPEGVRGARGSKRGARGSEGSEREQGEQEGARGEWEGARGERQMLY